MTVDKSLANDEVVLLDPATDAPIGTINKLAAHVQGRYHAAISVLLLDGQGRQILQQRSAKKYHGAGLWSNACCSHPFPGESSEAAATRRLEEELGIRCALSRFGTIRYRAAVPAPTKAGGSLIEHERVNLYCGAYSSDFRPNEFEVSAIRSEFMPSEAHRGEDHTPWFRLYMDVFGAKLNAFMMKTTTSGSEIVDFGYYDLTR